MKYVAKKINPYDYEEQLCNLYRRNLNNAPANRFKWLYRQSKGIADIHTWGLFKGQQLCGNLSLLKELRPGSMALAQQGGIFFDFMIDQSERTLFPAMLLVRQVIKDAGECGFHYLFGLPNTPARAVLKRCGLVAFTTVSRWVKIIDFQLSVSRCLPGRLPSKIIAKLLGKGLCSLSYFLGSFACQNSEITTSYHRSTLEEKRKSFSLSHNEQFILWRYMSCPTKRYFVFSVSCADDVVSIIYHNENRNIFVDKLLYGNILNVSPALNFYSVQMKKRGMERISIAVAGAQLDKQLKRAIFVPRCNDAHLLGIFLTAEHQFMPGEQLMFDGDMDI